VSILSLSSIGAERESILRQGVLMPTLAPARALLPFLLVLVAVAPGCAAVEGIFKAGMWVGIIVAILVIGGVLALISRFR
jgi:hypothetical protein